MKLPGYIHAIAGKAKRELEQRKPPRTARVKIAARWAVERLETRMLLAVNPIVAENQLPGTPSSVWNVSGAGDPTIQGYATDISVDQGQTVSFKINDTANVPYHIDIYRMGYYQGLGARLVTTISASQTLDVVQLAPKFDPTTALVDAGNWSVTASWAVPSTATSGVYFARVARNDTGGAFMIPFVVRDDASHSAILFQTSDETWEAYNTWGGYSLYQYTGSTPGPGYQGAAFAVSYNRPFINAGTPGGLGVTNWFLYDEYPMVRWLEENGYDVSYMAGVDTDRLGASYIEQHQVFLSVGHDEYWSGNQFANAMAARNAGVNLAFFSGNEVFWKTYFDPSIDGTNTPDRTLVCYKETHQNAIVDPNNPDIWTGTWEDPRFSPPADGGQPQNQLTGTLFDVNEGPNDVGTPFTVPYSDSQLWFWRNTTVANLQPGQTATLGDYELGYEWDEDVDNGFRPAGEIDLSSTTENVLQKFIDYGNTTAPGTATNSLTLYRASSGALVFGAGMVQYDWGLDGHHYDINGNLGINSTPVPAIQQATVNLFANMYVQPQTLMAGLVPAMASTDTITPTSIITSPLNGAALLTGETVTISGTASDSGGGVVAGVEVSVDGGQSWHPAQGTTNWTYKWIPDTAGQITIMSRATDDSSNTEKPSAGITVSVSYQPTSRTGLVGEYGFNEGGGTTLTDSSGDHNNGTISNATWAPGIFGDALAFNGTNSWVTINDSSSLNLTTSMTLEAWVNPASLSNWNAVVIKERPGGLAYGLYADNGLGEPPSGYVDVSGTDNTVVAPSILPLNTWSFLAVTYNGSDLSFYLNGTLVSTNPYTGNITTSTNPLRLGGDSIWGEYFNGLIDQVRIYNRPLNQGEIRSDMGTPVGGTLETSSPTAALAGPPNGAKVSGITTLSATASDSVYVADVQFLLDGKPLGSEITTAPYNLSWDTRTVANGSHLLSVMAQNIGGQAFTSASETITVDNPPNTAPPTVRVIYPPSGIETTGKFVLDSVASDPYGVTGVQYQLNGVNLGRALTSAPYRLLFDSTGLSGGTYTLTAVATDTSGNTATSSPVTITVDHTPPSVISTTPAAESAGVSTASTLSATFDEPVQVGSISVLLQDPSGDAVTTSVTYDDSTNTATITHGSVALEPLTTYTVTISATDVAGNTMAPLSWQFSTGNAIVGATIWPSSATPSIPVANDTNSVEVGVKFRSDVAGTITGVRFYKGGAANGGTHVAHLWSDTGTSLATATFTNETSFGWQQVNFSTAVPISANTTYVASYYAPTGGYASDSGYFASSEVNSGPLHALQDGTDGGNGLYEYGADGFPTGSYQSTNYWVDVVFNASTADTTPPAVTGEFPSPNSTGIAQTTAITATFSKAVQPTTISFVLKDSSGNAMPGTVTYDGSTNTATLSFNTSLAGSSTYTATVSGATDLSGNVMAAPFSWSFTTASASAPPAVVTESPAPGANNVAKGTSITATFSKPVDGSTISFVLHDAAGNAVASTVSYDDESSTATLTPGAALAVGTTYTAIVSGATDLSGNVMGTPFSWSFTTANSTGSLTIWNSATTPAVASVNDTNAVELGVKFTSDTAGYITGLRFYKGSLNTGTHVAHLWTSSGTLLATATFSGETGSGWQQVNFASPIAIAANTVYVASYYAPVGGYSANSGYFASSGADDAPLHALANGVNGGNGVYVYGAGGGFPTNSYNSTNYWVDVMFSNPLPGSAPVITVETPSASATGVSTSATASVTFNQPIQPASLSFTLTGPSGNVPGSVSYNSTADTATFTPTGALAGGASYTATVSAHSSSGAAMAAPFSWSFTTTGNWQQTTVADFSAGTLTNTAVTNNASGEVQLAPAFSDNFSGSSLSTNWGTTSWASQGGGPTSVTATGGTLSVAGAEVLTTQAFSNAVVEGQVAFAAPYQHFGLATDLAAVSGNSWAIFSTMGTTNTLFARVNANGVTQDISLGALPAGTHDYKVVSITSGFQFYVDGVLQTTINLAVPAGTTLKAAFSSFGTTPIQASSIQLWAASGTFVSSVFNAGQAVNWDLASWDASVPAGTTLTIQVRGSSDGSTWSAWQTLSSSGAPISPLINDQYLQYQVIMTTTSPSLTPVLSDITLNWS
jgi:hypothetical protein